MREARGPTGDARVALMGDALDELAGAVVVLDRELRVVGATATAEALLGGPAPPGVAAAKLLCGEAPQRPLAEALAEGRSVTTTIPLATRNGGARGLSVRALPLGRRHGGFALLLEEEYVDRDEGPVEFHGMWTRDPAMKRLFRLIERVARREASVLVRGETGAGKELVARAVHECSPRASGPFRAINCAALPAALLESELFGHLRGAFTGAVRDHPGHFRLASGGTLFLDEIGELPLELQAKLLRAVETRTIVPVGGTEPVPIDVRVVTATHRSLRAEVEAGRFRADLMYRLRVVPLFLPPLRQRPGDVLLLAQRIVDEQNRAGGRRIERIAPGAAARLVRHPWPGNVRELKNAIEYAFAVGEGPTLVEADLLAEIGGDAGAGAEDHAPRANVPPPLPETPTVAHGGATRAAATQEAQRLLRALERAGGNRDRAARILGLSRSTLWRRMRALGLLRGP